MTTNNLPRIDGESLWSSLMQMSQIGPGVAGGSNRQALTDADKAGRDLFVRWATEAGCTIAIDAVGNIFARRAGRDDHAPAVCASSHLDTQATGGKFDGVYGVLAGLEVVRTLNKHKLVTRRPIEVACWTNEEGCRFAPAMLGSGVVAGIYAQDFAYDRVDRHGLRFGDELERIGYCGSDAATPRAYAAMFETHIEQGPVLEHEGDTIGVVTGIQGAYWFDVRIEGMSCHAGPTPMSMRRDPWRAGVAIINGMFALVDRHGADGRCTIGDMTALPGARNTVPQSLSFPIDLRHPDSATLETMVGEMHALIAAACAEHDLTSDVTQVWYMPPTLFDAALIASVDHAAASLGFRRRHLVSGAGHDSLHTAKFAPTTMIFVPCAGGLSHNEAESATPGDLAAGADVLLHVMMMAAND